MIGFTKSIAKEFGARNIRCNAIAPGYIETEMTHQLSEDVKKSFMEAIPLKKRERCCQHYAVSGIVTYELMWQSKVVSAYSGLNV